MTEKNIFVCKPFLSLNISDFSLFFTEKLQPLLKKVSLSFPANLLLKLRSGQAPPPFKKFSRRFNSPPPPEESRGGESTLSHELHYKYDEHHSVQV